MRIKMKTMMAGPEGNRGIGEIVDVTEAEGRALLAGNYAEEVPGLPPSALPDEAVEEAVITPSETTVIPRARRRK